LVENPIFSNLAKLSQIKLFCVAFACLFMLSACAPIQQTIKQTDFYYFGINAKMVKEANWYMVILGAVTAVGVHTGGHYLYAALNNIEVKQDGFFEVIDGNAEPRKKREFAQAGPVLQNGVGLILTTIPATRKWDFTKGYVAASFVETAFYPALFRGDSGDLYISNKYGGNADVEYAIFTAVATHNMLRVKWHKD